MRTRDAREVLPVDHSSRSAFLLLSVALSIGPLTRLDSRFLPLLYNRRHLGVATCLVALAHGVFAIVHFHAFGDAHPLVSVLASNTQFTSLAQFPFQQVGLGALAILVLMAATSHDFWLSVLTPSVWKRLHMLAYVAYALVEFANGVPGSFEISRVAAGYKHGLGLRIFGTRGSIAYDQERFNELQIYRNDDPAGRRGFRTILAGPEHTDYRPFCPAPGHGLGINDLKVIETRNLLRAIAAGGRCNPTSTRAHASST